MYYSKLEGEAIHEKMSTLACGYDGRTWSLKTAAGELVSLGSMQDVVDQVEKLGLNFVMFMAIDENQYALTEGEIEWNELYDHLISSLEALCETNIKLFHDRMFWQAICNKFFDGNTETMEADFEARGEIFWEFYQKKSELEEKLPKLQLMTISAGPSA